MIVEANYLLPAGNICLSRSFIGHRLDYIVCAANYNLVALSWTLDALFTPVFTLNFLCLSCLSCNQYAHRKTKRSKASCQYYSNSSATRQLLLMGGDISRNPGPIKQSANRNKTEDTNRVNGRANRSCKTQKQKCLSCEKTIRCNQKQISCFVCFSLYHIKCVGVATDWSCSNCLMSHLPYFKCSIEEILDNDYGHQPLSPQPNPPRVLDPSDIATTLQNRPSNLRVMHLNTQSMVSTFNEFLLTVNNYALDIITLSETYS